LGPDGPEAALSASSRSTSGRCGLSATNSVRWAWASVQTATGVPFRTARAGPDDATPSVERRTDTPLLPLADTSAAMTSPEPSQATLQPDCRADTDTEDGPATFARLDTDHPAPSADMAAATALDPLMEEDQATSGPEAPMDARRQSTDPSGAGATSDGLPAWSARPKTMASDGADIAAA